MRANPKDLMILLLTTLMLAAAGAFVGDMYGHMQFGIITGFAIGLPLGRCIITGRRRWFAIALLNGWFALCYATGGRIGGSPVAKGLVAAGYAIGASVLTFFVSAAVLREFYRGGVLRALSYHLRIAAGFLLGIQIIDEGKTVFPTDSGSLMGPRLVIIQPGNAAILEMGPRQTRISGHDIFTTRPFENIKRIYDLQQKQRPFTFNDILTSDGMPTTVHIYVTYGLDIPAEARMGCRALKSREIALIRRIDAWMPEWERLVEGAIEASVRQTVSGLDLAALLTQQNLIGLQTSIRKQANSRVQGWGLYVYQVVVQAATPKRDLIEAQMRVSIESERLQAWGTGLAALAKAYTAAESQGMSRDEIHCAALHRTLELIARDPATKLVLTPELDRVLSGLLQTTAPNP